MIPCEEPRADQSNSNQVYSVEGADAVIQSKSSYSLKLVHPASLIPYNLKQAVNTYP